MGLNGGEARNPKVFAVFAEVVIPTLTTSAANSIRVHIAAKCSSSQRRYDSAAPKYVSMGLIDLKKLDKLVISQLGFLAQRRLARGVKLNHAEASVKSARTFYKYGYLLL